MGRPTKMTAARLPAVSWVLLILLPGLTEGASYVRRALEAPLELDNGWEYQGCYVCVALGPTPRAGSAANREPAMLAAPSARRKQQTQK